MAEDVEGRGGGRVLTFCISKSTRNTSTRATASGQSLLFIFCQSNLKTVMPIISTAILTWPGHFLLLPNIATAFISISRELKALQSHALIIPSSLVKTCLSSSKSRGNLPVRECGLRTRIRIHAWNPLRRPLLQRPSVHHHLRRAPSKSMSPALNLICSPIHRQM